MPVPSILSVTDGCFSFLPLVPQSHTLCNELQGARLFKITTQLSFHDDRMLIACVDFKTGSVTFPPPPNFSISLSFFLLLQQLLCGASTIAAEFFNLFPGAECLEEISDFQKHFNNLSEVLL